MRRKIREGPTRACKTLADWRPSSPFSQAAPLPQADATLVSAQGCLVESDRSFEAACGAPFKLAWPLANLFDDVVGSG